MSGALAIAGVTALLKHMLDGGLSAPPDVTTLGTIKVSALPPDRIVTGASEPNQLNLFLYLVTPNQGWRNVDLPSKNGRGERMTNHALALNLHYLLTGYGQEELHGEILLGRAMQILHETPVPMRQAVRNALAGPLIPGGSLTADDLADQAELIKISPQSLSSEEMSKLWTAFQAKYRPSAAYMVSVVLIEATDPVKTPLPVLKRGKEDRGVKATTGGLPVIESVTMEHRKPAAELGKPITILGRSLVGDKVEVVFKHQQLGDLSPRVVVTPTDASTLVVPIPKAADPIGATPSPLVGDTWLAGFYSLRVIVTRTVDHEAVQFETNEYPFALAPRVTAVNPPSTVAGDIPLTATVEPMIHPHQRVSVLFGDREIPVATPMGTGVKQISVTVPTVPVGKPGEYVVRVRIDGVDSIPLADPTPSDPPNAPPAFAGNQTVRVT